MGAILGDSFKTILLSSLISSSVYASARTVKSALSTPADVSTTAGTKCLLFTVSKYLNFFPLLVNCHSNIMYIEMPEYVHKQLSFNEVAMDLN